MLDEPCFLGRFTCQLGQWLPQILETLCKIQLQDIWFRSHMPRKGDFTCNSFLRLQYSLVLRFPNATIETVKEILAVHVLGSRTWTIDWGVIGHWDEWLGSHWPLGWMTGESLAAGMHEWLGSHWPLGWMTGKSLAAGMNDWEVIGHWDEWLGSHWPVGWMTGESLASRDEWLGSRWPLGWMTGVTNDWESSDSKDEVQGVLMARQSRFLFRINPQFCAGQGSRKKSTSNWWIVIGRYETPSPNTTVEMLSGKPG